MKGTITTIQRMSIHDGPGIRSTIFLKGCNFRCRWCHNPETHLLGPEIEFIKQKCIACKECLKLRDNTLMTNNNGSMVFSRDKVSDCRKYSEVCYSEALHTIGEEVTAKEVLNRIKDDIPYFTNSGGGITISGGEPLLQPNFCRELLVLFKASDIHTAIETNFSLPWQLYEAVLPYLDLLFIDLKQIDEISHNNWIGAGNKNIIENIRKLDNVEKEYIIRTPIIPEFNNNENSLRDLSEFIEKLNNIKHYELLPYHPLADSKYENLGIKNPMEGLEAVQNNELNKLYEIVNEYRIPTNRN